ncbi:MAG: minor capsid protein [Oscillospiraceae bacterium]|nr:minor capsid protein [Oscillospiraceae bacterium]
MKIMPIPDELLGDAITLFEPTASGFRETEVVNVRVDRTNSVTDFNSAHTRDTTEITVYYDCENSRPSLMDFSVGMQVEYRGERFEIIKVKRYCAVNPHHYTITARKIGGQFRG